MKHKILKSLLALAATASVVSCEETLDINKDPRYPAEAATPMLFASGVTWSSSRLGRDGQLVGEIWSQHYTQNNAANQYKDIDSYNLANNNTYPTNIWASMYYGALPDFKIATAQAEANGEWNYWLAAKVMTAFDFHLLVSFFEKIPFTEALKGEEALAPKYDEGKVVDAGIVALLDEAIAKKDEAAAIASMGSNDFVFGGDIGSWVKFAKTLKLKIYLRDFDANKSAIDALLAEGDLLTTKDAAMRGFIDATNSSNPLYEADRRALNTSANLRASATLVAFLTAHSDPRVAAFFEPVSKNADSTDAAPNTYRGLDQGAADAFSQAMFQTPAHSRARLAATDPVYFMSGSDSYFLQAEAYVRLVNTAKAKESYDAGVTAAFARWGYEAQAATFTGTGGAYELPTGTDDMLKAILTQKWVSTTRCNSWDAFFDICRTGIPALGAETVNDKDSPRNANTGYVAGTLTPSIYSVLPVGDFPRRFLFTKSSSDYNPNAPEVLPIAQKMWWHKQ
ncbi:MAG: SusD/RagB family nutrient-binding outer membrane lipoprotein [Prevotellaceae bacterium]|jgi:hypothetical protein|nr:SusD/RagB family nutrient-binding outer membrane lipoprotein [Prevotellaceae bacterium]